MSVINEQLKIAVAAAELEKAARQKEAYINAPFAYQKGAPVGYMDYTVHPGVAAMEYGRQQGSQRHQNEVKQFAEADKQRYLQAVANGYEGPQRVIKIPDAYVAKYENALGLKAVVPVQVDKGLGHITGAANLRGDYRVGFNGDIPINKGMLSGSIQKNTGIYTAPINTYAPEPSVQEQFSLKPGPYEPRDRVNIPLADKNQRQFNAAIAYANGPHSIDVNYNKTPYTDGAGVNYNYRNGADAFALNYNKAHDYQGLDMDYRTGQHMFKLFHNKDKDNKTVGGQYSYNW